MRTDLTVILLVLPFFAIAQEGKNSQQLLCDKKWYGERMVEPNGKTYAVSKRDSNEYVLFNKDGIFETLEDKTLIKGKWIANKNETLTITQSQTNHYPARITFTMPELTDSTLGLQAKDVKGRKHTMYYKTR